MVGTNRFERKRHGWDNLQKVQTIDRNVYGNYGGAYLEKLRALAATSQYFEIYRTQKDRHKGETNEPAIKKHSSANAVKDKGRHGDDHVGKKQQIVDGDVKAQE